MHATTLRAGYLFSTATLNAYSFAEPCTREYSKKRMSLDVTIFRLFGRRDDETNCVFLRSNWTLNREEYTKRLRVEPNRIISEQRKRNVRRVSKRSSFFVIHARNSVNFSRGQRFPSNSRNMQFAMADEHEHTRVMLPCRGCVCVCV